MDLDRKALELKRSRVPFCWATVVRADGSSPRHAGAKMLVTRDESFGTVGGGGLEHQAIDDARAILRLRAPKLTRYDLTDAGIQPCGGTVEIFFEPVAPQIPLILFGAGHVAEKLAPLLVELDFEVTLVDERAERLELPAFDRLERKIAKLPAQAFSEIVFSDELYIVCMTHAHEHDEEIVEHCLGKPFAYLGLISSRHKWALFGERYRAKGIPAEQIARVASPIGFDIGAETPMEIAVAVAAQLIQLRARPEDFKRGIAHFVSSRGA